ncbi:DMT family transporter [Dictyobacter aurantiacus]|uniref:Multidrug transporter n=1 Tax=Dictyobacter aurantiacus TaxID=1936993 RepID=A0A401ZFD3_9CHLR|nr:DMT family transporter [Dictyobacter aurantiacus]GCE05559.1 multidrug transporter [Dictyobacter aurantiacus]
MQARTPYSVAAGALLPAVSCWGMAPVATRYLLTDLTPIQIILIRFAISTILLLPPLLQLRRQRWSRVEIGLAILCGLLNSIGYNLTVAFGLHFIAASLGGILIATEPIWILLLSLLITHERPHWSIWLGFVVAAIGIGVGTLLGNTRDISLTGTQIFGAGLTLLAAFMWSAYTILIRPLTAKYGASSCTALTTFIGTLPLFVFYTPQVATNVLHLNVYGWLALCLLTVGSTVIATMLWNYGVASMPGSQAGLFLYLVPLISVIGGALFLHEVITAGVLISGVLILAGVCIAQARQFMQQRPAREPLKYT